MAESNEKIKERSVAYPYYDLKECIEFAKVVHKLAGKGIVADSIVAKELDVKTTASSFTYKVSSSKQFGLISRSKEGLGVTQRIKNIIYPLPGQDLIDLYRDAVKIPPLYAKIFQQYSGEFLPEKEGLSNVMLHQGIAQNAKDRAAKVFLSSIKFAEMLGNDGFLNESNEESLEEEPLDTVDESKLTSNEDKEKKDINPNFEEPKFDKSKYQRLDLALANERSAIIIVPTDINKKDVDRLTKLLELTIIE